MQVEPVAMRRPSTPPTRSFKTTWPSFVMLTLLSCAAVLGLALPTPITVYNDPTAQLKALQQYLAGTSPNFNTLVAAKADDLSRNEARWVSTWAPGMGMLLLPLLRLGLGMSSALRILAAAAFVIGSLGWVRWLLLFDLPQWLLVTLAVGWPWMRYANNPLFQYYTESLTYAIAPWLLVGAVWLARRMEAGVTLQTVLGALCVGLGFGVAYWLKYSGVFLAAGLCAFLCIRGWRQRNSFSRSIRTFAIGLIVAVPFLLLVAGLNALNRSMGASANYVVETAGRNLSWRNVVDTMGFVPLAMADADSALQYIFFKPSRPQPFDPVWLRVCALPVAILTLWLVFRRRTTDPSLGAARWALLITLCAIFGVWSFSRGINHEARHIAAPAMALVPAVLAEGILVSQRGRLARKLLLIAAIGFIFAPLAYGAASVIAKSRRVPHGYQTTGVGLYHPALAISNESASLAELLKDYSPDRDVWYAPDGLTALFMPGRMMVRQADFESLEHLRGEVFKTSVPLRVLVLLPRHFEQNGKGVAIRSSFVQAERWEKLEIPGCDDIRWAAELEPELPHSAE